MATLNDNTPRADARPTQPPDFAALPSAPRARRWILLAVYALLLALACAAIWWIDRGAGGK